MIECILAWICIIMAFSTKDPWWGVASALFAMNVRMMPKD